MEGGGKGREEGMVGGRKEKREVSKQVRKLVSITDGCLATFIPLTWHYAISTDIRA